MNKRGREGGRLEGEIEGWEKKGEKKLIPRRESFAKQIHCQPELSHYNWEGGGEGGRGEIVGREEERRRWVSLQCRVLASSRRMWLNQTPSH